MSSRRLVPALVTLALGLACKGFGGKDEPSTLTVTPETATVTAGGPGVEVHAQAGGDVGLIEWTLEGPGSLTTSQGDTTAYVPPERVAAETSVTVTARMYEVKDTCAITVEPSPTFVLRGRAVTRARQGLERVTVTVPGVGSAVTDATGAFALPGVSAPYDLAARLDGQQGGLLFLGLRREDPTVMFNLWESVDGTIAGQVAGGAPAEGHRTLVAWGTPVGGGATLATDAGVYALTAQLHEEEAVGPVHALQWEVDGKGWPVTYTGHAALAAAANHTSGNDLVLGPAATATLTFEVGAAGGGPFTTLTAEACWEDLVRLPLLYRIAAGPGAFTLPTPAAAERIELTLVNGALGAFRRVAPESSGIELALVAPPNPVQPPDGATGVDGDTPFSWQVMGAAAPLHVVTFRSLQPGGPWWTVEVLTMAPEVRLPDPAPFGIQVTAPTQIGWNVFGTTAVRSVDEAAGPDGRWATPDAYLWGTGPNELRFTTAAP